MTSTESTVFQAGEVFRSLLADEAAATRKYLEYKKKTGEWSAHRQMIRDRITGLTGNAPVVKIGDEVVLTFAPKDQFSGTRFAAEYPDLAAEFTRVRAESYLDVEALREAHPDLAARYTVKTFVNKVA
jgi:hypothetical protein